jgi:serpin B
LFFSPYSISTGMGMVYAGARGHSEREIAAAMRFNLPQDNLHAAFGELAARMNNVQHWDHLALRDANSLWFQRDYSFTPAFMNLVRTNYHADARPVDFRSGAQSAGREMSAWIRQRTGGRLEPAFNSGVLTADTRLALCNAIYFNGEWASQFKHSQTKPAPFHVCTNETITVPMMRQKADFKTARDVDAQVNVLEMPYYGRDLSMIILMPGEMDGLTGLEQQLNPVNLKSWMAMLDQQAPREIWILLPRFTVTRNIDLAGQLKTMGLASIFRKTADLSGMEATTNLYVSDFFHQAFVEVNEHGTEATAMTIAVAATKSMTGSFVVDHPFIFLIRENATGTILFLGRMVDPTKP